MAMPSEVQWIGIRVPIGTSKFKTYWPSKRLTKDGVGHRAC
jgi:hypothetical protein